MREDLLELAPQKIEAIILTKKRKVPQVTFKLLDNPKLAFAEHVNQIINKAERITTEVQVRHICFLALMSIPNIVL